MKSKKMMLLSTMLIGVSPIIAISAGCKKQTEETPTNNKPALDSNKEQIENELKKLKSQIDNEKTSKEKIENELNKLKEEIAKKTSDKNNVELVKEKERIEKESKERDEKLAKEKEQIENELKKLKSQIDNEKTSKEKIENELNKLKEEMSKKSSNQNDEKLAKYKEKIENKIANLFEYLEIHEYLEIQKELEAIQNDLKKQMNNVVSKAKIKDKVVKVFEQYEKLEEKTSEIFENLVNDILKGVDVNSDNFNNKLEVIKKLLDKENKFDELEVDQTLKNIDEIQKLKENLDGRILELLVISSSLSLPYNPLIFPENLFNEIRGEIAKEKEKAENELTKLIEYFKNNKYSTIQKQVEKLKNEFNQYLDLVDQKMQLNQIAKTIVQNQGKINKITADLIENFLLKQEKINNISLEGFDNKIKKIEEEMKNLENFDEQKLLEAFKNIDKITELKESIDKLNKLVDSLGDASNSEKQTKKEQLSSENNTLEQKIQSI